MPSPAPPQMATVGGVTLGAAALRVSHEASVVRVRVYAVHVAVALQHAHKRVKQRLPERALVELVRRAVAGGDDHDAVVMQVCKQAVQDACGANIRYLHLIKTQHTSLTSTRNWGRGQSSE